MGLLSEVSGRPANLPDEEHGPLPAECLGLGLIRTLDTDRGLLYLLTPLPLDQLQRVNTLQVPSYFAEQFRLANIARHFRPQK